jgi:hypothetical protein
VESQNYSIQLERVGFRTCALHYKESGRYLRVYLEESALPEFDWVGLNNDLRFWTEPNIPSSEDEQKVILNRLEQWCSESGARIYVGPPADFKVWLS